MPLWATVLAVICLGERLTLVRCVGAIGLIGRAGGALLAWVDLLSGLPAAMLQFPGERARSS